MWRSILKTAGATLAFSLVHSVLASDPVKRRVRTVVGGRAYDGLYRSGYNVVAIGTLLDLRAYVRKLPDRELYHVRGPLALAMRVGQGAGLAYAAWATWWDGPLRFGGLDSLGAWAVGAREIPDAAVGQGPSPSPEGTRMETRGPFQQTRHPLNLASPFILWLNPRMTANLAAFNTVATLYFAFGSLREEARLRAAYEAAYGDYQESGVPLYLPGTRAVPDFVGKWGQTPAGYSRSQSPFPSSSDF